MLPTQACENVEIANKISFIIATFAEDGALKCIGLEVEGYSLEKMQKTFGEDFKLLQSFREEHQTPSGATQNFIYAHFQINK